MLRHQFLFGCNIFLWGRAGSPAGEAAYRERFADIFNFATLPFYWGGYEREKGKPLHESREAVARWCREKGIATKGHPLVWNHPASVPPWLPDNPEEVRKLSMARTADCASRFKGLVGIWDVVNEAVDPWRFGEARGRKNPMTEAFRAAGVVPMVLESFAAARTAGQGATLLINDYRTDEEYARLIEKLVLNGKPVYDAIGIQSHMHDGAWPSARIREVCDRFARFGVPLHFTETTLVSGKRLGPGENWGPTEPDLEERQAREAVRFYTVLFGHPAVEALTWWDFSDRGAWQGAAAGFLRRDLSPKPAYEALRKLIREEWWTRVEVETEATGLARARAFFGEYEVIAKMGGRSAAKKVFHDRKKGSTEMELVLQGR
jgi:endo-1,4-beta-xylanase